MNWPEDEKIDSSMSSIWTQLNTIKASPFSRSEAENRIFIGGLKYFRFIIFLLIKFPKLLSVDFNGFQGTGTAEGLKMTSFSHNMQYNTLPRWGNG